VIGVIDYQTGNSQSVVYALDHLGLPSRLVSTPADAADTDRLILPGVGSAGVTMRSLRSAGWVDFLNDRVLGERALFLGICVGMQVLFEHSEEEDAECLGWLPGRVQSFTPHGVRVPQIGWNKTKVVSSHPLVANLPADQYFYFVNSYYSVPSRPEDVAGTTEYGVEFASMVARDNVMATQFHTEKSGPVGLRLLHDFATLRVLSELGS
jgi:imidazole glycerol-phosphate synthase subunit HisH